MEALSLLRQYTMGGKKIREDGDYFIFGHRRIPKDTRTAWKSQVGSEVRHAFRCSLFNKLKHHIFELPLAYAFA